MRHLLWAIALLLSAASASAADLRIDPTRSRAEFAVRLLWVSTVSGSFEGIRGDLSIDREARTAVVRAVLDTESIRMESARLRRWVLAPEFFDSVHYPQILFTSDPLPLELISRGGEIKGKLTMRGVTRDETFHLQATRCPADALAGCVLQLQGTIDRTDFEMRGRRGALSDRVNLGMAIVLDHP
ncbi:MAG: YceI family protein [Luteibacter sp.]|uniref:YceI family protein n=1 Tax=Rhodanobacteraceae TaxID=1775411 RepID=UPI0005677E58|nr:MULTISPECIES: YceI family protein [Rhodanobacteraceae]MDQ7995546.1 YceI family protein [Luteibacter sp.]MDQ8047634.1 YceI family protein [Luteibacter sp.]MDR6644322.1 polyisoprenoid-binding protein YceI [Luteibacter sp. 1214]SDG32527.1 Polyisoprenoid-binding protein YceI [Dyella sp. 333MFSha]